MGPFALTLTSISFEQLPQSTPQHSNSGGWGRNCGPTPMHWEGTPERLRGYQLHSLALERWEYAVSWEPSAAASHPEALGPCQPVSWACCQSPVVLDPDHSAVDSHPPI